MVKVYAWKVHRILLFHFGIIFDWMESSELTNANTSQSQHFKALKELKEADKQFFSIQNRIKAIQINEMKNLKRVENSQREVEKIMQIRQ